MATMLRSKGLITYKSELLPPEGALAVADNIIIDEEGVVEPRRGLKDWGTSLPLTTDRIKQLLVYKDRILHHYNSILSYDSTGDGVFTAFAGSYMELDAGLRLKYQESNGNLYFTTTESIKKISAKTASNLSAAAGYVTNAGGLKALDVLLSANGTSGYLEPGFQVAYRIVWGIKDTNENLVLGAPSARAVITNTPTTTSLVTFNADITAVSVTLQNTGDTITYSGTVFANGNKVVFNTISGTTTLLPNNIYYVISQTPTTFQVSATSGGSAIALDADGAGVLTLIKSTVTLAAHGFANDSQVYFTDIVGTPGVSSGQKYYVINALTNTFQISSTLGGDFITLEDGTATVVSIDANPSVNVQLAVQVPAGATSDYFIQVYRTPVINSATLTAGIFDGAGDEMQQVLEQNYNGTDNPVTIIDDVINEFQSGGAYLYTNQISGVGIAQANDRPPIAKDIALFRNSMFYANTRVAHKASLNLLSAEGLDGFTFAIGNGNGVRLYVFQDYDSSVDANPSAVTLTGGIIGADQSGTPSQNIDTTARNLTIIVNDDGDNPVAAFYVSTSDSLPGLIIFEADTQVDETFYFAINNVGLTTKFKPALPVISPINTTTILTSTEKSDNDAAPNRVYFSKTNQPEAVPSLNNFPVGPKDKAIHRIMSLRDSLFVLKEDGVYTITGSGPTSFSVRLLDNSAPIIAPDTAAVLNNRIYCLSSQGVVAISETGVEVLSLPIENLIRGATKEGMNFKYISFGVGYENDRCYFVWLPIKSNDTVATQAFRYNTFTDGWTRFLKPATSALVHPIESKLYLGAGDRSNLYQERKSRTRMDYADREFTVNFLDTGGVVADTIYINSSNGIAIRDSVVQTHYLTIAFLNRFIKRLDKDAGLTNSVISGGAGYYATYAIGQGDILRDKLVALDAALAADPTIGTYTPTTFGTSFEDLQSDFNTIIVQLNSVLTGTSIKTYRLSTGNVYYEALVTGINPFLNTITLTFSLPLLFGDEDPLVIYKAIKSVIQWAPQHFGAPDMLKQVCEGTVLFDQNNFYSAIVSYQSDLSRDFSEIPFLADNMGVWGLQAWGELYWGGEGSNAPFRTLIPTAKQKCRYITARFEHKDARNQFRLIGISFIPRQISCRGYH